MSLNNTFQEQVIEYFTGPTGGGLGFQGRQGLQGVQGDPGFNGFQGNQGWQGFVGTQGAQGIYGAQGDVGFGFQGNQGFGFQGNQGFGFQGNVGVQGFQGTVGDSGKLYYYDPNSSTGSATINFTATDNAYYECTLGIWVTGLAGGTGTITVNYAGVSNTTTMMTMPGYGYMKFYINNYNTGNTSKLDCVVMTNSTGNFTAPTNTRYLWSTANAFPQTLIISSSPTLIIYYVAVSKFT